uniref:NADH dehydrogenase subunit 6 n=1 Tax=Kudoa hexapunctata TaxID=1450334 RepID=A0A0H5B177_9CNID|nr:NADH dehydrogenase subunit 6 [Kudoa hexapunctata]BAR94700.1 NADH dehydrogenase subunit 6 [Kudoa hexapunctata]
MLIKEALMLLYIVSSLYSLYALYLVLLLGTSPSFLLAFLLSRTTFPGRRVRNYVLYSSLVKSFVLILDQHILSHLFHTSFSLLSLFAWGTFPLLVLLFLTQHRDSCENQIQCWSWLMVWWVQDSFIFVLGSSGFSPWWLMCLHISTYFLVPMETFSIGSLGHPWFFLWWAKALVQCHVFLITLPGAIFICLVLSALILLARIPG